MKRILITAALALGATSANARSTSSTVTWSKAEPRAEATLDTSQRFAAMRHRGPLRILLPADLAAI